VVPALVWVRVWSRRMGGSCVGCWGSWRRWGGEGISISQELQLELLSVLTYGVERGNEQSL